MRAKLPPWIRVRTVCGAAREHVESVLESLSLNTVCRSAKCPNLGECWGRGTATFMILGSQCTRNCRFCAVAHGENPSPPDNGEPAKIAEAARRMNLKYVVVTSVTRDDLPDGGAKHFAKTIREIRERVSGAKVEVLTPDFQGVKKSVEKIIEAAPDVFNHNVETVERLSREIRGGADFRRSLNVLEMAAELGGGKVKVKSGLMAGMGETDAEIEKTIREIRKTGAAMLTIGQYLPPGASHWTLHRYVEPELFNRWRDFAEKIGFESAACAPLVRSSYNAEKLCK